MNFHLLIPLLHICSLTLAQELDDEIYIPRTETDEPQSDPIFGFNCGTPTVKTSRYSLTHIQPCEKPEIVKSVTNQTVQILLTPTYRTIPVFSCSVYGTFTINSCTLPYHTAFVTSYDRIIKISRSECEKIIFTKSYKFYGQEHEIDINKTNHLNPFIRGRLSKGVCLERDSYYDPISKTTYDDVVVQVRLKILAKQYNAQVDIETNTITLHSGLTANFNSLEASDVYEGNAYWSTLPPKITCDITYYHVLYTGLASVLTSRETPTSQSEKFLVVNTKQRVFAVKILDAFNNCGSTLLATDHPNLFLYLDTAKYENSNDSLTPDLMSFFLSKLLFQEIDHKQTIQNLHLHSLYQRCLIQESLLRTKLALLQAYPNAAGQILFPQPTGKTGMILGDTILLTHCEREIVRLRLPGKDGKCHTALPIYHGNHSAFLSPINKIIIPTADEIPCSRIAPAVFQLSPTLWVSFSPELTVEHRTPIALTPTKETHISFDALSSITTHGLFSIKEMRDFVKTITFTHTRSAMTASITNIVSNSQIDNNSTNFSVLKLFSQADFERLAKSTFKKIFGWVADFGLYSSAVFGFWVIFNMIRYAFSVFFRCCQLKEDIGCSIWLVTAFWSTLHNAFMFHRTKQHVHTMHSQSQSNNLPLPPPKPQPFNLNFEFPELRQIRPLPPPPVETTPPTAPNQQNTPYSSLELRHNSPTSPPPPTTVTAQPARHSLQPTSPAPTPQQHQLYPSLPADQPSGKSLLPPQSTYYAHNHVSN